MLCGVVLQLVVVMLLIILPRVRRCGHGRTLRGG